MKFSFFKYVLFLSFAQVGCQVEVKDKNKPNQDLRTLSQSLVDNQQDFYLNQKVVLTENIHIRSEKVRLGPQAEITTNGFELKIEADFFKSENAQIKTFENAHLIINDFNKLIQAGLNLEQAQHPQGIVIVSKSAEGFLYIDNIGLNGRDGQDFSSHRWPEVVPAAQGPTADYREMTKPVRRGPDGFDMMVTYSCQVSNAGAPGTVKGADALPGGDGEDGGDTALLQIDVQQKSGLVVKLQIKPGVGGAGGRASEPQKGQRGGAPGPDPQEKCRGGYGANAPDGYAAKNGMSGKAGEVKRPQIIGAMLVD